MASRKISLGDVGDGIAISSSWKRVSLSSFHHHTKTSRPPFHHIVSILTVLRCRRRRCARPGLPYVLVYYLLLAPCHNYTMLPKTHAPDDGARHRLAVPSGDGTSSSSASHHIAHHASGGSEAVPLMSSSASSAASSFSMGANPVTPADYLGRLLEPATMDFQSALDQCRTLLGLQPQRIYKTSYYRKQTKNHWARDDPAFAVVQVGLLLVASLAYSVAFRPAQGYLLTTIVGFAIKSVHINFVGVGAVMATVGKQIADRRLATVGRTHVKQTVEWLYAFDIHCNAFFPFFVMVYGIQFFLLPIVLGTSVMSLIISNTLFAVAFSWYFYITHLGYRGKCATRRLCLKARP